MLPNGQKFSSKVLLSLSSFFSGTTEAALREGASWCSNTCVCTGGTMWLAVCDQQKHCLKDAHKDLSPSTYRSTGRATPASSKMMGQRWSGKRLSPSPLLSKQVIESPEKNVRRLVSNIVPLKKCSRFFCSHLQVSLPFECTYFSFSTTSSGASNFSPPLNQGRDHTRT